MANEVILKVRVLNEAGAAILNRPVMLMNPDTDANPFAPNPTVVVSSGNTDTSGYVAFTGVNAGVYDIKVIDSSGNSILTYNYAVKNSYLVDPANVFESRFAVRSGEHIQGVSAGIIARVSDAENGMYSSYTYSRNPVVGAGILTGTHASTSKWNGTGTTYYQDQFNGTIFSVSETLVGKQTGNSYYHDNQNITLSQKVDIVIGG